MSFEYNDLLPGNKISDIIGKYGMMSWNKDILYWSLFLDFFPDNGKILELGTYIGGSLLFVNEHLRLQNKNVTFTTVDHLKEIGKFLNTNSPWNLAKQVCDEGEYSRLLSVESPSDAIDFIESRSLKLTNFPINLRWFTDLTSINDTTYDIIFQDFGANMEENFKILDIVDSCLNDEGIFIVDDYDTAHITRVIATMKAIQDKRIYPIMWGARKAFFAKSIERARELINSIVKKNINLIVYNDDYNKKILRFTYPFPHLGINYSSLMDLGLGV